MADELPGCLEKLLPHLVDVIVESVERWAGSVVLWAWGGGPTGRCPHCGTSSGRVHGRYLRQLADAALGGCRW